MSLVNKTTLKSYFETGDQPSQLTFVDVFDSILSTHSDDNQTIAGDIIFSGTSTHQQGIVISDGTVNMPFAVKSASLTLSTSGATHKISNWFTIGMVPLSFTIKVTTAITNNAFITSIGTDGDADRYVDSITNGKLEEANDIRTFAAFRDASNTMADTSFDAVDKLMLTTSGTPGAGVVLVAMTYIDGANFGEV